MTTAQMPTYRMNPLARDWTPASEDAVRAKSVVSAAATPAAHVVGPHWGPFVDPTWAGPIPAHVPHTVDNGPNNHAFPWFPSAWMDAKQSYFNYCYYWHMYQSFQQEQRQETYYCDSPLPTVAAFQGAPLIRDVAVDAITPLAETVLIVPDETSGGIPSVPTTKTPSPSPQFSCGECNVVCSGRDDWHRHPGGSGVSCFLCGELGHRYTACRLFDGKTVCFINTADSCIYAMRHERWIERATLHDVYLFVYLAVGIVPVQVVLRVGTLMVSAAQYPPETRCCDLQLLPGAVVAITQSQPSAKGAIHPPPPPPPLPLRSDNVMPSSRVCGRQLRRCEEEEEALMEEGLDVSTIAKASELSVSISILERNTKKRVTGVRKETLAEDVSSAAERPSRKYESSPTITEAKIAAASLATPSTDDDECAGTNSAGAAYPTSTAASTVPDPTAGKEIPPSRAEAARNTLCYGGEPLDWAELSVTEENFFEHQESRNEARQECATLSPFPLSTGIDPLNAEEPCRRRRTVHVRFIPVSMSFSAIRRLLWSCGEVYKVRLVKPQVTTNPRRMFYVCFVEYATEEGAMNMMRMQGHRVAESFRLAVEYSRHPIRGGYVTDRDVGTGKPCTFGLGERERRAVELRFAVVGPTNAEVIKDSGVKVQRRRGVRRRRGNGRHCAAALTAATEAEAAEEEEDDDDDDNNDNGAGHARGGPGGPYALQIVATTDLRKRVRVDGCRGGNGGDAESGDEAAAPLTMPAAVVLPRAVSRDTGISCEQAMRERLRCVVALYVRQTTPKNFYEVLTVLEEIKWNSMTPLFHLSLMRCEVALFLHHDHARDAESAGVVAAKALNLGSELLQLLAAVATGGSTRVEAAWRLLFTRTPPSEQQHVVTKNGESTEELEEGAQSQGNNGASRLYPNCSALLSFAEILLHIGVLLDRFHGDIDVDSDVAEARMSAEPSAAISKTSSTHNSVRDLLLCVRDLLTQLQTVLDAEEASAASGVSVWSSRAAQALQQVPTEADWRPGCLMSARLPDVGKLLTSTLTEEVEMLLF
ncbi:hypothetical protein DQ04_00421010 [Trypanosoma grayi]|uniref:hypothetical protein n=1 Tax=Trypanosoma grayi TaxID=71804 RepID=UPI0004F4516C|nr:hypothetical protein DQ04_00421010 [Trypanosoma grayi]KEG14522.1 hypothetical protein DQ04_00421010 [Trypanosoma grayi]